MIITLEKDVAVDLDGIVVDPYTPLCKYHNDIYKTHFTKQDLHSYNFEKVFGITQEEAVDEFHDFMFSPYAEDIMPEEGAVEGVNFLLSRGYNLHVVTSRAHAFSSKTYRSVNTFFPNKFASIHLANHFAKVGKKINKSEICSRIGARILLEDCLEYATECAASGIRVILLDQPWNQTDKLPELVERAMSWKEIVEKI